VTRIAFQDVMLKFCDVKFDGKLGKLLDAHPQGLVVATLYI
jgi:hypothetical protein